MALITYPLLTVRDDSGAIVDGATVEVASVKGRGGADVTSPDVTLYRSGPNVSVSYDAAAKGEAWITLAVAKSGSIITGWNASPSFFLAEDSSWLKTLADAGPPPDGPPPGIILNFRSTVGYVTDGEDEAAVLPNTDVGTLNGYSWQWSSTSPPDGASNDSNSSPYPPELAGCSWKKHDGDYGEFVVTLPAAGTYDVGVALGSAQWGSTYNLQSARIYDDTTLVHTICFEVVTDAGEFVDVNGNVLSGGDWQAARAAGTCYRAIEFATTTLRVRIADPTGSGTSTQGANLTCLLVRQSAT